LLFLLFPPELSASGLSFSAAILAADGPAAQRTASRIAVLSLFLYRSHGLARSNCFRQ
jgi:hypothetical protein